MTDQPLPNNIHDAASLIGAVATLVAGSTQTIVARLEAMERSETNRWKKHDEELDRNRAAAIAQFEKIELSILVIEKALKAHLDEQHDDDLVMQARVQPVRNFLTWTVANWRNIIILLVGILGFIAVAADIASKYLGGP